MFLLGALVGACAGDDAGSQVCTPGKTEACPCPGGQFGAQACKDDGSGFDMCMCPGDTDSGGSGGTSAGTAAGTSTSGGSSSGGMTTSGGSTSTTGASTSSGGTTTQGGTTGGGEIWLRNDGFENGGMAAFQQGFVQGECWASVYVPDPGNYPFAVTGVEMLIGGNTNMESFELAIYDVDASNKPTTKLDSVQIGVTGAMDALNQADFQTVMLSQPVFMSGNFAIAMCLVGHSGFPAIARDADGDITADRNWIMAENIGWVQSQLLQLSGDWIMRARIEPQ